MRGWLVLLATLALSGCMGFRPAPLSPPGCTDFSAGFPPKHWWECLDDPPLAALVRRERHRLPADIAHRYIALRAQQAALVLLAEREELDVRMIAVADALPQMRATAQARLAQTRVDQQRARTEIAGLRDGLALLLGTAPGSLDRIPGGPIPLPPLIAGEPAGMIARRPGIELAKSSYAAARAIAAQAQAQAEQICAAAAQQDIRARAGTVTPAQALDADRQALDALQAEQQARAAMTQAYVALVESAGPPRTAAR